MQDTYRTISAPLTNIAMADHERHQATFTTIPEELSTNIIEHLDVKALTALSRTSPPFYRLANPLDISRRPQLENFLLLLRQKKNSPYPRLLKRSRRDSFLDNLSGPPKGSVEAVIVTWPGDPRLREALLRWNVCCRSR